MTTSPANVSVVDPVHPAFARMKEVLFQPFDLGKWFVIGFGAWLAHLGESGANFNVPGGGGDRRRGGGPNWDEAREFIVSNLYWIIPLVVAVVALVVALGLLITWLNSRGKFMFLHCVATNRAEVKAPWAQYARQGNSLFLFRVVAGLLAMMVFLPLLAVGGFIGYRMGTADRALVPGILMLVALGLVFVALAIVWAVFMKFTTDFAVPIMYRRGCPALAAWRELLGLLTANAGRFALYILFSIAIALVIGVLVLAVILVTCCIAGCFMAIPYIGTVLLLPVLMFKRCYSLCYFAQYGREYDVFAAAAQPAA